MYMYVYVYVYVYVDVSHSKTEWSGKKYLVILYSVALSLSQVSSSVDFLHSGMTIPSGMIEKWNVNPSASNIHNH